MDTLKVEEGSDSLLACRICLAWDGKLFNIREWGLEQMFVDITGSTLSAWDGFPQHICSMCRAVLLKAHTLRSRCRYAQDLLKQWLMHQPFIPNSYIRTIDRSAHRLTHNLNVCMNATLYEAIHDENQIDEFTEMPVFIKDEIEIDVADIIDSQDDVLDLKPDTNDFAWPEQDFNDDNINTNRLLDNDIETNILAQELAEIESNLDKPIKNKARLLDRAKKNLAKKQKLTKKNKFSSEGAIKEFEEKYDFIVKCLTEQEMVEDMERRRLSEKYLQWEFKCELCFRSFSTSNAFENHVKLKHDQSVPNECHLCHTRYRFAVNRNQHVQDAHRLQFKCRQCDKVVSGEPHAIEHAAQHAGATFKCRHCDKHFLKKTTCATHMRLEHPVENAAGGTCEVCGETFISRTGLNCHKTRAHNKPYNAKLHCRKCRMQFDNVEALQRHKANRPGNKCDPQGSICCACGEWCGDADGLVRHKHAAHGTPLFTCHDCTKSFLSKSSLSTHMDRVHRGLRPVRSREPGAQPPRNTGSKVCETCGKTFQCFALLKQHQLRHTGDRPFKCELCPKSFATAAELRTHHTRHTGEKPHKCDRCVKCYATAAALKVHIDAVHIRQRQYRCGQCSKTFLRATALSVHRVVHTGEKKFECSVCGAKFTQAGSLATHRKYVHLKIKPPPRKRNR